jgi:hypothetical protein
MKDLGPLHHFLRIIIERRPQCLCRHQRWYVIDILEHVGMSNCKPCSTPVDTQAMLFYDDGPSVSDEMAYWILSRAFQYLTLCRPTTPTSFSKCAFTCTPCGSPTSLLSRGLSATFVAPSTSTYFDSPQLLSLWSTLT